MNGSGFAAGEPRFFLLESVYRFLFDVHVL